MRSIRNLKFLKRGLKPENYGKMSYFCNFAFSILLCVSTAVVSFNDPIVNLSRKRFSFQFQRRACQRYGPEIHTKRKSWEKLVQSHVCPIQSVPDTGYYSIYRSITIDFARCPHFRSWVIESQCLALNLNQNYWPNFLHFMQFRRELAKINRLALHFSRLGKPGSSTENTFSLMSCAKACSM